jgi:RNA polymerase sigma factor for flagellar operon FliA
MAKNTSSAKTKNQNSTDKISQTPPPSQRSEPLHPQADSSAVRPSSAPRATALKAYTETSGKLRQDQLIIEYLPMVHKIVHQVVTYLHPPLTMDDMVSAGTIGLVKAARDFDPTRDAEFKTYAYIRIRGAVIDELRGWSFAPATVKRQLDQAQQIAEDIRNQTGLEPTDQQIAQKMNIPKEKLYRLFENARARHFLSIHGLSDESPSLADALTNTSASQPEDKLQRQELLQKLSEAIQSLPQRQRQIIILYYTRDLTMKDIAEVINVTESRVSQLHASALFKMSNKLKKWYQKK